MQGDVNVEPLSATQITNNGNFDTATDGNVKITGADLAGITTPAESIPAANFKAADTSETTVCTTGISLVHNLETDITSVVLPKGAAGSNTGDVRFCLTQVPDTISSQEYSATGGNAWTIAV